MCGNLKVYQSASKQRLLATYLDHGYSWSQSDMVLAPDPAALPRVHANHLEPPTSVHADHRTNAITDKVLRCKRCRRTLATTEHIVNHPRGPGPVSFTRSSNHSAKKDTELLRIHSNGSDVPQCSVIFIEAMEWIQNIRDGGIEGVLVCPNRKCGAKLGSWSWAGMYHAVLLM